MLAALATSHKIGIAVVAGVFILFALVTAVLLPRYRESFPGRGLPIFIGCAALLTAAMLTTIVLLAAEPKESEAAEGETTTKTSTTAATTTTSTEAGTTTTSAEAGDPVAGKTVFTKAGCVACHTLKAANATGTVGPNLDEAKPSADLVIDRVTHGKGAMPPFGDSGQLSDKEIRDVAAFVVSATQQS